MDEPAPAPRVDDPPQVVTGFASARILPGALLLYMAAKVVPDMGTDYARSWPPSCLVVGLALLNLATGVGLLRMRRWARRTALTLGAVEMCAFPIGTILSGVVVRFMAKPGMKVVFSAKPARDQTPEETRAVAAVRSYGSGLALLIVVAGSGGALFLPLAGVLVYDDFWWKYAGARAAAVIDDMRSVASAEEAYRKSSDAGTYGSFECLAAPQVPGCLSAYKGGPFLDPTHASVAPGGYRRMLTLTADRKGFIYSAVPLRATSSLRSFCLDETGTVRTTMIGESTKPVLVNGRCNAALGSFTLESTGSP
jgi:hypothetical protein